MSEADGLTPPSGHSHVYLGEGHERAERRSWAVIWLCSAMMFLEIVGGVLFGSIALVADGLHMSTHASALLLAALAYSYARRHAHDPRFTFGTGKLGDLAGFTSAIALAMIALLIGYEAVSRLFAPVPIHFGEAIPIAVLGLLVNIGSVWLLSGGEHHHHGHGHSHARSHTQQDDESEHRVESSVGPLTLSIFEDGVPPRFRLRGVEGDLAETLIIDTLRTDGARQNFAMAVQDGYLESVDEVPEPHAFAVHIRLHEGEVHAVTFEEHAHADHKAARDNNLRAAIIHVTADATVSVLTIVGLLLARAFGWLWMDPVAGVVGALVIAAWAYNLVRDTGAILLDMTPDQSLAATLRQAIEVDGDRLSDLHLWRLGPGHLGAIVAVTTAKPRGAEFYHARLSRFPALSHLTVEVQRSA
ncbi:CDF family Co(II)/Ni(II) efflux transporter DmeF [Acidisoma cellulosilytica]|uniref:CDF family Co(II)/Ni(II) efflux transporter DmeF n=1 Tax=Acidisoma cellulosilyticum TaxID=2802395 RepID=A0A964E5W9_9PROT|nr:CDF family Co(II)/Ni(II) efflux transporter DmeF [Acidisoma cellulosilyticum]MCB8882961.1 CDF family Co(II)/Ni(II) efflux transporter DmeF [Acidisoma cellulosilyticum]